MITKSKRGRPRKIVPSSNSARQFLDLYLDPLRSVQEIIAITGIRQSTFYNWEQELGLQKLRIGFATVKNCLPRKQALNSIFDGEEKFELDTIRTIAKIAGLRIKIIPVDVLNGTSSLTPLKNKTVHGVIASLSQTAERKKNFIFSNNYFFSTRPCGVIYTSTRYKESFNFSKRRPVLGVVEESVHCEHALTYLSQDYEIKVYKSYPCLALAVVEGRIPYLLFHPKWLEKLPLYAQSLVPISNKIPYKTESGVAFHPDHFETKKIFNSAIEKMYDLGIDFQKSFSFESLSKKYKFSLS